MDRRFTNLGLLAAVTLALATGWWAFAVGTAWVRLPVVLHGVAGLAVIGLTPWKSLIIWRGVANRRPGWMSSLLLTGLSAITLASGILFSAGLARSYGAFNPMQVHVGAALVALPLMVVHVWRRPVKIRGLDLDRRKLLQAGGLVSVAGLGYVALAGVARVARLPGRHRRVTGSYDRSSFVPGGMPVTQWFDDSVQRVDSADWSLRVSTPAGGSQLGYREVETFDDRMAATLDCTSGWYSTQEWAGVRLDRLVGEQGSSFVVRSASGYARRFPLSAASSMLLATRLGGRALSAGHGFPARVVAPGRRGFWWVKWVEAVEVDDRPWWWQLPFPVT
jgi:hypothetical protein